MMIKGNLLLACLSILIYLTPVNLEAQSRCKVEMEGLEKVYKGECKKGKAHGKGKAEGELGTYEGEFSKGYPDGKGVMIYADGSKYDGEWNNGQKEGDAVLVSAAGAETKGYWDNDEYVGLYKRPYEIRTNRGPAKGRARQVDTHGNTIEIRFRQGGAEAKGLISQVLYQNSSGTWTNTRPFTGFENVEFPFEARIDFTAPNQLRTQSSQSVIEFTIYHAGTWEVLIDF